MQIPAALLAEAAECYRVFAFDEGTAAEIQKARVEFNELNRKAFELTSKATAMQVFHRPTASEFRYALIDACRTHLREKGKL